jgi:hypothetical protein
MLPAVWPTKMDISSVDRVASVATSASSVRMYECRLDRYAPSPSRLFGTKNSPEGHEFRRDTVVDAKVHRLELKGDVFTGTNAYWGTSTS